MKNAKAGKYMFAITVQKKYSIISVEVRAQYLKWKSHAVMT